MIEEKQKMRACSVCKKQLPLTDKYFYAKRTRNYFYKYCKDCARENTREYNERRKRTKAQIDKNIMNLKEKYDSETIKDVYAKRFKKGDRVRVSYKPINKGKRVKYGRVVKLYEYFILIQLKGFKESYLYQSIRCGDIKIEGEWE